MSERLPNAETILFEGCNHFFLMEQPAKFMKHLTDWLERSTPKG
jgi:pimeloyl-ACP methyl ester carboxylesterase